MTPSARERCLWRAACLAFSGALVEGGGCSEVGEQEGRVGGPPLLSPPDRGVEARTAVRPQHTPPLRAPRPAHVYASHTTGWDITHIKPCWRCSRGTTRTLRSSCTTSFLNRHTGECGTLTKQGNFSGGYRYRSGHVRSKGWKLNAQYLHSHAVTHTINRTYTVNAIYPTLIHISTQQRLHISRTSHTRHNVPHSFTLGHNTGCTPVQSHIHNTMSHTRRHQSNLTYTTQCPTLVHIRTQHRLHTSPEVFLGLIIL